MTTTLHHQGASTSDVRDEPRFTLAELERAVALAATSVFFDCAAGERTSEASMARARAAAAVDPQERAAWHRQGETTAAAAARDHRDAHGAVELLEALLSRVAGPGRARVLVQPPTAIVEEVQEASGSLQPARGRRRREQGGPAAG